MHRILSSLALAAFIISAGSGFADAKTCKGKNGKFVKCPSTSMMAAHKPCRDPKTGKFMKCK